MKHSIFHPLLLIGVLFGLGVPATARAKPVGLLERIPLTPVPASLVAEGGSVPLPHRVSVIGLDPLKPGDRGTIETLQELFDTEPELNGDFGGDAPFQVRFEHSDAVASAEGYELDSTPAGVTVRAATDTGAFYGAQTVYQLLAYSAHPAAGTDRGIPQLRISDAPAYRVRSVMADLGRAPYSPALLRRLVRIMGQLKLNLLHLHLYDDQLCGFRFKNLPLGQENPFSLDAAELTDLVRYARIHHVAVMPELESWGHVGSILYHYPELSAGRGEYSGSFAIGQKTYALLDRIYDEIVPCLEDNATVHVGLDEANWALLPGEDGTGETPTTMVARIHAILMRVAARHHQHITMQLWADHRGRPLPPDLQDKVVIEPWRYLGADAPSIVQYLEEYGGAGKTPFMMGAGANSTAFSGNYEATRIWCEQGRKYPNNLGVTLCLWESNDLAGRLVTLYGGANFAWSPATPGRARTDTTGERLRQTIDRQMRTWQILFPDADPAAINHDRGPEVKSGRYVWPPFAGKAVAPTCDFVPPTP